MKRLLFLLSFILLFSSCGQYRAYQKVVKSTDPDFQYTQALSYYQNGDYARSLQLFENLLGKFQERQKAESIYYHYIYCNYYMKDYLSAAYHAKNFNSKFILSDKKEEIAFLAAHCYYMDTPRSSLDQANTYKAIDELQLFINTYPSSDSLNRINDLMLDLNVKLEKKNFDLVKLYYETGKYQSAIYATNSYLLDFPESIFIEQINYIQLKSYYELAKNSIDEKKQQRLKEAIFACDNFLIAFPLGNYKNDVQGIYEKLKNLQNGL